MVIFLSAVAVTTLVTTQESGANRRKKAQIRKAQRKLWILRLTARYWFEQRALEKWDPAPAENGCQKEIREQLERAGVSNNQDEGVFEVMWNPLRIDREYSNDEEWSKDPEFWLEKIREHRQWLVGARWK